MSTISTCIIVKNEIDNIPGLISDLRQFSDEIIVVDTGSTDGTLEWLQENQDGVLKLDYFEWVDHFAKARNHSFSQATMDWIFWCDADDRISQELIDEILKIKPMLNDSEYTAVFINYLFSEGWDVVRRRLLRRSDNPVWVGACHEYVKTDNDNPVKIDDDKKIIHQRRHAHTDRNLNIFIKNILAGEELTTRDYVYYSNELRDAGMIDKAYEIAAQALYRGDIWNVDAWNLIIYNMASSWMMFRRPFEEGLSIIEDYEKIGELRGDVYYIKGLLAKSLDNKELAIESFGKALEVDSNYLSNYGELELNSKIYPAIELYELVDDKDRIVEFLKKYENDETAQNFLKEIGSV